MQANELSLSMPLQRGSYNWYDNYLLKYSDTYFFGQIDNQYKFALFNVQDVENPESFNPKVNGLLSSLSYKASST